MQSNHPFEFEDAPTSHKEEDVPMNCDQVWDLLSVYADGEATPHEAEMVEAHIAVCASCASDLEFLRSTSVSLRDVPEVEPPAMLRQAILAATVNRPTWQDRLAAAARRTFAPAPLRYGALAAAGAAAALTFVMIHDGGVQVANPVEYHPTTSTMAAAPKPPTSDTAVSMPPARPFAAVPSRPVTTFARTTVRRYSASAEAVRLARANKAAARPSALKPRTVVADRTWNGPSYKIKVETPVEHSPDYVDAPPVVATAPKAANAGETMETLVGAAPANTDAVATQKGTRIVLASSNVDAGAVMTFAALKSAQKDAENNRISANELRQRIHDHQIRIDVIKGSF